MNTKLLLDVGHIWFLPSMLKAVLQSSGHLSLFSHPFLVRQGSSFPHPTFESEPTMEKTLQIHLPFWVLSVVFLLKTFLRTL